MDAVSATNPRIKNIHANKWEKLTVTRSHSFTAPSAATLRPSKSTRSSSKKTKFERYSINIAHSPAQHPQSHTTNRNIDPNPKKLISVRSNKMNVNIWGCRGSISRSHPSLQRYGGNTPCVEVVVKADAENGSEHEDQKKETRIVLDMGR